MTVRPSPLRMSTSLAILVFDWLVFALNMTTHLRDFTYSTALGACAAALTVALIEQHNDATSLQLVVRATVAGAIVAVPLPMLGTAVALVFMFWSALVHVQSQRSH